MMSLNSHAVILFLGIFSLGALSARMSFSPTSIAATTRGGAQDLTLQDVEAAQKSWSDAIVAISKCHKEGGEFVVLAGDYAGKLYGAFSLGQQAKAASVASCLMMLYTMR